MSEIDVTMTATRRPDIIAKTLSSFSRNMFDSFSRKGGDVRFFVNVDPVPENVSVDKVKEVFSKYPFVSLLRSPPEPNFPKAFKWTWSQARAKYIFHLEDDWELLEETDLFSMIGIMDKNSDLAALRLPDKVAGPAWQKSWNKFWPWNGEFFECPEEQKKRVGMSGHPSLVQGVFVRRCAALLWEDINPEKQFHGDNHELVDEVMKWQFGAFSRPNGPKRVKDIGRKWMIEHNLVKAGSENKAYFRYWRKVDSGEK